MNVSTPQEIAGEAEAERLGLDFGREESWRRVHRLYELAADRMDRHELVVSKER